MKLKHKLKIFQKLMVFLLIITMCLSFNILKVNAWWVEPSWVDTLEPWVGSENPYSHNPTSGNCTWYAWGRAKHKLGISLPGWGDAGDWADNAARDGYTVDYNASEDSIVVWPRTYWPVCYYGVCYDYSAGHVAYVEKVEGDQMWISESNWENRKYNEPQDSMSVSNNRGYAASPRFIHLQKQEQEEEVYKPKGSVQNLGNDFIATINVKKTPSLLLKGDGKTNGSKVILSSLPETNTSVMWNFIRRSDGTYSIKNIDSGLSIDVFGAGDVNGEAVQLWKQENGDKNNWFIYDYNGAYRFVPRSSKKDMRALDILFNDIKDGQVLQLWDAQNDSNTAQTFLIRKFANSISLNNTSLTLEKGQTTTLKATYNPSDTYYKNLTWKSSNSTVATVKDGKITAKSDGVTTITAETSNHQKATCKVIVGTGSSGYLKGDLDFNSKVEVLDAVEALYYYTEVKKVNDKIISVGDFNDNKKIDVTDAVEILMLYVNE